DAVLDAALDAVVQPEPLAGPRVQAQDRTARLLVVADCQTAIAKAEVRATVGYRRRAPRWQLNVVACPDRLAPFGVEAEDLELAMGAADGAATVDTPGDDGRIGINVQPVAGAGAGVLPQFLARAGVQAVQPVVAGAEIDPAVRDARARLDVALRLEGPQFL